MWHNGRGLWSSTWAWKALQRDGKSRAIRELHNLTAVGWKEQMLVTEGWKCVWGLFRRLCNETPQVACFLVLILASACWCHKNVLKRSGHILRTDAVWNKVYEILKMWYFCLIFPSADAGGSKQRHWWSDGADQTPAGEAWQAECAHQDAAKSGEEALRLHIQRAN